MYMYCMYSYAPPLSTELAQAVVDAGAVPLLVLCIQEPELSLKRISASALSDVCKHSTEVDANTHHITPALYTIVRQWDGAYQYCTVQCNSV